MVVTHTDQNNKGNGIPKERPKRQKCFRLGLTELVRQLCQVQFVVEF
jgi:hypothetical protein